MIQITKYGIVEASEVQKNVNRLTNQIWKLIPMKENEENWQKQLDTVIIDITGMNEVMRIDNVLLQLLSKLEGLREAGQAVPFDLFRKTVFEAISLLQEYGRGLWV